ncbi:MAG: 16S rRNA (cytidine(1402)-2'-O)-methyltransferase [Deltaproteobacteria bacterium]|nr:16S rRNA (cytidine(1402)-2'-O)-methyltransferase [Deltaproteobacteria bacterium]
MSGTLYVVATPIGNLEDITLRAVRILRDADRILAEDTRHTGRLLKHLAIETRMTSVHGHNEKGRVDRVLDWLSEGQTLALVSDAGTPAISDPGQVIVAAAREAGYKVAPVPGACAFVAAASAAGLPTDRLHFVGFLPGRPGRRKKVLNAVLPAGGTTAVYVSPHRVVKDIAVAIEVAGADRPACLCRELTKMYEEFDRGTLGELHARWSAKTPKGEMVLLIAGD